jgi:FMN phosphatase YigB (HAD superfamily)
VKQSRRVFSFDVFDTALTRTIYPPGNVWLEVGRRLRRESDIEEPELEAIAHAFAAQRLAAEKDALARGGREDVELLEVYRHFEWLDPAGISPRAAMRMELAVERGLVFPINETLRRVEQLQAAGERVVFISDTYLSRYTVLRLLRTAGYKVDPDQVYVSSTLGWTKYSGNLFLHVLNKEGISAEQLQHSGDNTHSDIMAAARVGVAAEWFGSSVSSRYEQAFGRYLPTEPTITAHCVGLLRAARMSEADRSIGPVTAAGVVAPTVTCFASWVLQQAQRNGADLILFIARDGEIIFEAASALTDPNTPPLRVFETSRRSVFSSLLDPAELETFAELLREPERIPLREILRRFHLESHEIARAEECGKDLLGETRAEWQAEEVRDLLQRAGLLDLVLERAARAKTAFRAYCEQQGLFASRKPLFVDVGWGGSYEKIIERIFTAFGIKSDWQLAYFGLSYQPTKKRALYGRCVAYANRLGTYSHDCETSWDYTRHVEVIEAVCTPSPRGPVISYALEGGSARAVRREVDPASREIIYASALHRHVASFARMFKGKELHRVPAEMFRVSVLTNLATFLQNPSPEEVTHLVGLSYLSGFDNSEAAAQPVAMAITTRDAFRLLLGRAFRGRMPSPDLRRRFDLAKLTWPEAARLLTPRWARAIKRRVPTPERAKWWLRRMVVERNRGPLRLAVRGVEYYKRTPRPDVTSAARPRSQRNGQIAGMETKGHE